MLLFHRNPPSLSSQPHRKPAFVPNCRSFTITLLVGICLTNLAIFKAKPCWAGASGCNWVVVVNAQSTTSRTIANRYSTARNIPSRNVIVLPNIPETDQITVDQFRELILIPILKEIESRGLGAHIQGIAYSADFPTAIDIQSDLAALPNRSPYLTPVGSINGLTFLFRLVLAKNPMYVGFESNLYAARPALRLLTPIFNSEEQPKEFEQLIKESKHEEAAKLIESIIASINKELSAPMHYLSAQQWALAKNDAFAIKHIEQAIRAGWSYRDQILKDPAFASLSQDKDFQRIAQRCKEQPFEYLPSRGFEARTFYSTNTLGSVDPKQGVSYMMSMVLAVTRDLGITKSESERNLRSSIGADYTFPNGSFIYTKTADVRTLTREPNFGLAVRNLKARGMNARVVEQDLPPKGEQCSGLMIGTPEFLWARSGCTLLPGSIADNLTSLGGAMTTNSQTKATELLRFGAAASSGAVTEPYSIQNKFPHPMIQVHYVDGLTAAESFYSSVTCPYQLLIVGDPLCQPYCKPPRFSIDRAAVEVLTGKEPLRVKLEVDKSEKSSEPELLQLIIDGVLKNQSPFEPQIQIGFNSSDSSAHEVRLVTIGSKPLENRFEKAIWVSNGKTKDLLTLEGPDKWQLSNGKPLKVSVKGQPKDTEVRILHDSEVVGTIAAGSTSIEFSPSLLGYGSVRLQAVQIVKDDQSIQSLPLVIQVEP